MILIAGIIFIGVGIFMIIRFMIAMNREKIPAHILAVSIEFPQNAKGAMVKKFPHAQVEYWHNQTRLEKKILLKSKSKVGETIQVAIHPNDSSKVEQYYPKKELLAIAAVLGVGIALIVGSVAMMDILSR